jgi:hypothetical protein
MHLRQAASYFADTTVSGWNGTRWIPDVVDITILPSDRFVSVHEFDTNCQYALVDIEDVALDRYTAIKVEATGQIFIVGFRIDDVSGEHYSKFYLLRRSDSVGTLFEFQKSFAVSGMAKSVQRSPIGEFFCDVEHVTSVKSANFKGSKFSDCLVFLPRDCPVTTGSEVKVGNLYYDVNDVFDSSGFKMCRAIAKRSS